MVEDIFNLKWRKSYENAVRIILRTRNIDCDAYFKD